MRYVAIIASIILILVGMFQIFIITRLNPHDELGIIMGIMMFGFGFIGLPLTRLIK
jgi:predicted permease